MNSPETRPEFSANMLLFRKYLTVVIRIVMYFTGIVNSAYDWSRRFFFCYSTIVFSIQNSIYICVVFFLSVYNPFRDKSCLTL